MFDKISILLCFISVIRAIETIPLIIPLTQIGNSMLGANLEIGIPPQKVTLMLSTQSSTTYLFNNTIDLGSLGGKKDNYVDRSSSTFKTIGESYEWTNGKATAKGIIAVDIFTAHDTKERNIKDYRLTSVTRSIGFHSFGLITSVKDWDQFMVGDGMLGLATGQVPMSIYKATKLEPNFVSDVAGKTASTVMSLWIDIRGTPQMPPISGQLTFGSIDSEHCRTNSTRWVDRTDDAIYQFRLHSVRVPLLKKKLGLTQTSTSNKFVQAHFALKASSNRGYVYGPNVTVQTLAKLVGAEYNWTEDSYSIVCEKRNTGPVIEFELDGGQLITIGPQHYVIQESKFQTSCDFLFHSYKDNTVIESRPDLENFWQFGQLFLRSHCVHLETATFAQPKSRMGFSRTLDYDFVKYLNSENGSSKTHMSIYVFVSLFVVYFSNFVQRFS